MSYGPIYDSDADSRPCASDHPEVAVIVEDVPRPILLLRTKFSDFRDKRRVLVVTAIDGHIFPDLQKPRSEHVLMIEVLLSSGTEEDRKRLLLSAIVTRLQAAGTDPNDVMVFFGEIDRASSSFGGGRPALPVEVRP